MVLLDYSYTNIATSSDHSLSSSLSNCYSLYLSDTNRVKIEPSKSDHIKICQGIRSSLKSFPNDIASEERSLKHWKTLKKCLSLCLNNFVDDFSEYLFLALF